MNPGRELDALVAWDRSKLDPNSPREYRCSRCAGSDYFISGKERRRICKPCHKAHTSAWRKAHPDKHNNQARTPEGREKAKVYRRNWQLNKRYGMSSAEYDRMFELQKGACLICLRSPRGARSLDVDHCHKTGVVRGLLCNSCNIGIANFRENMDSLARASRYLAGTLKAVGVEE